MEDKDAEETKTADTEKTEENRKPEKQSYNGNAYFFIAIGACALGVIAFGLAFTKLGLYSLICSIILQLAALSFLNTQKKVNNFKAVFYVKIAAYALLAIFALFFIGGLIYVSTLN